MKFASISAPVSPPSYIEVKEGDIEEGELVFGFITNVQFVGESDKMHHEITCDIELDNNQNLHSKNSKLNGSKDSGIRFQFS